MSSYSLLITSCQRDDLLKRTIESFLDCADLAPREIVIVDDGPERPMPDFLQKFRHLSLKWLCNGTRQGQIHSCDRLWRECSHDYAFWCEEDWHFAESGFIKKSLDILKAHPEVFTVTLRGDWGHPLVKDPRFPFQIAELGWRGGWGSFCFNPGMRRKSDYTRIGSYGKRVGYGTHGLVHEIELSKLYAKLGYVLAALPNHCCHIGAGRSRAVEPIERTIPKVLIAVPACHKFNYGRWESGDSPHFNQANAWNGQPYGTGIHISGLNPRIQAVRETWAQDCKPFDNFTVKFFYGLGADRARLEDEVFLPVDDDYEHLPQKTIAIVKWALANGYDYVLKCDDDTYIYMDRLVQELNENRFDYAGYLHGSVCTGGTGYWLSRRAMAAVQDNPNCWAEDVWVGKCMQIAGIEPVMLTGHRPGYSDHWFHPKGFNPKFLDGMMVTAHAVQPEVMRNWYAFERGC